MKSNAEIVGGRVRADYPRCALVKLKSSEKPNVIIRLR